MKTILFFIFKKINTRRAKFKSFVFTYVNIVHCACIKYGKLKKYQHLFINQSLKLKKNVSCGDIGNPYKNMQNCKIMTLCFLHFLTFSDVKKMKKSFHWNKSNSQKRSDNFDKIEILIIILDKILTLIIVENEVVKLANAVEMCCQFWCKSWN